MKRLLFDENTLSIVEENEIISPIFVELGIPTINGVGYTVEGKHEVPVVNGVQVSHLKYEFTARFRQRCLKHLTLNPAHADALRSFNDSQQSVRDLLPFATLKVGSVGSRSTNWSMSFEIEIDYIVTKDILTALRPFVTIVNKDRRNADRIFGYNLTCCSEVEQFIDAAGIQDSYLNVAAKVEAFQNDNDLRKKYDGERISDYKAKTYIKKVKLAA